MINCNFKWIVLSGHSSFESGGVGTHLRILQQELKKSKYDYIFVLGKSSIQALYHKSFIAINRFLGLCSQEADIFLHISLLSKRLKNALKKSNGIDVVVHCHDFLAVLAAIKLKDEIRDTFRIVYTVHAPFSEQFLLSKVPGSLIPEIATRIESAFLSRCDGFIFVDNLQKTIVEKKIGNLAEDRCLMLPNAVNLEVIEGFRLRAQRKPYIVVARHLYEKCGVHVALEAFSKASIPENIKLVIIGDGDQRDALKKQAFDLGVSSRVVFLGKKPYDISLATISEAMLSIVPSIPVGNYIEATSLTMLESLALGVPLIASDIGGLKQVLSGTNAGVLVAAGDVCQLVSAIENVIKNPEVASELSQNSIALIELKHSSSYWFIHQMEFITSIVEDSL